MACYDCECCSNSVENDGKCKRFEYNCPFLVVDEYNSEKLKAIRETVKSMSDAIEQLKKLDTEYYMEDEIRSIKFQLSLLEDKVNEDTEKEWNEIAAK